MGWPEFWSRVAIGELDECWLWTGATTTDGYGSVWFEGRSRRAHRVVFGEIEAGLEIDHLCRNRRCVNPRHLEAVPHRENVLRGQSPVAVHAVQTHCVNGHPLDAANTYIKPNGHRDCRTCIRERVRRYAARKRVAA